MIKTDDEIINDVSNAVNALNEALKDCAAAGIIIDMSNYDTTDTHCRVRRVKYSFSADKRLVGGL